MAMSAFGVEDNRLSKAAFGTAQKYSAKAYAQLGEKAFGRGRAGSHRASGAESARRSTVSAAGRAGAGAGKAARTASVNAGTAARIAGHEAGKGANAVRTGVASKKGVLIPIGAGVSGVGAGGAAGYAGGRRKNKSD